MSASGYALFDTAIGLCGIAWTGRGIAGVRLPEATNVVTRAWLMRRCHSAAELPPPCGVREAINAIVALLAGEAPNLSAIALDMESEPEFHRRVFEIARAIPPGATLSYGEIAARLGDPALAREVGVALARNPFPIIVPCHRVIAANFKLGGFSAPGGSTTKRRLLAIESPHAKPLPLFR